MYSISTLTTNRCVTLKAHCNLRYLSTANKDRTAEAGATAAAATNSAVVVLIVSITGVSYTTGATIGSYTIAVRI
jgi:hypothetical protein